MLQVEIGLEIGKMDIDVLSILRLFLKCGYILPNNFFFRSGLNR